MFLLISPAALPQAAVPLALQGNHKPGGDGGGERGPGQIAKGAGQPQEQNLKEGPPSQSGGEGRTRQSCQGGQLVGRQEQGRLEVKE